MNNYQNNLPNLIQLLKNNIETMQENLKIMENICTRIEKLPPIKKLIEEQEKEI